MCRRRLPEVRQKKISNVSPKTGRFNCKNLSFGESGRLWEVLRRDGPIVHVIS